MPKQTDARRAAGTKRFPLNMRTTKAVRERLERVAAKNGRSLVQEVEFRLEHSFRDDRLETLLKEILHKLFAPYDELVEAAEPFASLKDPSEYTVADYHALRGVLMRIRRPD